MTQNTKIWVRRIYFAAVIALLVTAAVLLMVQCVAVKRLGDHPFTRQRVAEYFAPIAIPVYACVGLVAAGFALSPLLPPAPDSAPDRDAVTLHRLQRKTDLSVCPAELTRAVCKARRARNRHHYIALALLAIGSVVFLWYGMDMRHFSTEDPNGSMVNAMLWLLPCMGVPCLYSIFTAYFCRHSIKTEIGLLRTAPKEAILPTAKTASKQEWWMPYAQAGIFAVGVGLVVYGLLYKGAVDTLWKAVNICKECIGMG